MLFQQARRFAGVRRDDVLLLQREDAVVRRQQGQCVRVPDDGAVRLGEHAQQHRHVRG